MTDAAAELMNRTYRHQRHIYDFTRKYYLLGRDGLIAALHPPAGGRVLEIGCGTGRNLITAARRYPGARFFGVDLSTEMLQSANRAVARAGLAARIALAYADATRLDPDALFRTVEFERIFVSYSLSMIPDWHAVLETALTLLAPGGELHIVDFGGQRRHPALFRRLLRSWLSRFHVTPRDELEFWLRARCTAPGWALVFERPFADYAQYARVTRRTYVLCSQGGA